MGQSLPSVLQSQQVTGPMKIQRGKIDEIVPNGLGEEGGLVGQQIMLNFVVGESRHHPVIYGSGGHLRWKPGSVCLERTPPKVAALRD